MSDTELRRAVKDARDYGCEGQFSAEGSTDPEDGERGFWVPYGQWQCVLVALDDQ